jgi:hypothetical protein
MYKLLPEKYIAGLKREYHFRLVTACFFFIGIAILVGGVALAPSYILSKAQGKQAITEMNELKKNSATSGADKAEQEALAVKSFIDALKGHEDPLALSELIEAIVAYRGRTITIASLDAMKDSPNTAVVHISGLSPTRDSLITFKKNLESDPRFTKVDLPVSDLAKSKNIRFTITARIKW